MSWVTNMTLLRVAVQMRCSSMTICSRVIASSAPNGSSISSRAGSWTSARQIDDALAHAARQLVGMLVLEAREADAASSVARPRS